MKTFLLIISINLMIGCYRNVGPKGDVVGNGDDGLTGYWKLSKYEIKGKPTPLNNIPERLFLKTQIGNMDHDSVGDPFYKQGTGFRTFSFYDANTNSSLKYQGVLYNYDYNKKTEQTAFYYRMNEKSGFLAVIDRDISTGVTSKIKLSSIMNSTVYKPEADSLRYIYEPTAKFD